MFWRVEDVSPPSRGKGKWGYHSVGHSKKLDTEPNIENKWIYL
jgi:hypothetical protein